MLSCSFQKISVILVDFSYITILVKTVVCHIIQINAPGPLQIMSPENDTLETKCVQIYKHFTVLESFWVAIAQIFPIKSGRGHL